MLHSVGPRPVVADLMALITPIKAVKRRRKLFYKCWAAKISQSKRNRVDFWHFMGNGLRGGDKLGDSRSLSRLIKFW
jgi:hypothetical protein